MVSGFNQDGDLTKKNMGIESATFWFIPQIWQTHRSV
jgi:hypothetical protein